MSKRPAVALIIPGGIGTGRDNIGVPVLRGLVKLMAAQYDLTIFQLSKTNDDFTADGFELISVYHSSSLLRVLRFPFTFKKYHERKNFVAVHGFWAVPSGMLAVVVGKLFGVKSIVSLLGGDAAGLPKINYGRLHRPLFRSLTFWTLRRAANSNALTQYLVNNLTRYGFKGKVDVIPWGVDGELFDYHPKPLRKPVAFLHIANLHPVKDQETLLRAFEIISTSVDSKLTIVGSGVDQKKVTRLIAELKLSDKVTIIPFVPYEKLSSIYHSSDILLHTSLSEGQSEVVTEAMSCGVVVCGTRTGLIHDLPGCCVSVDVGDYRALAEKTIMVVNDPVRMNELRMQANQWTMRHDILWTAKKLMSLYGS